MGTSLSAETLSSDLSYRGVEKAVALSLQGIYYDYVGGNEETLESSRRVPFIIPAATIDPRRFYGRTDERIGLQNFAVLRLFPGIQGWPVDFAPFRKILEKAASVQLPIMLPASGQGRGTQIARLAHEFDVDLILTSVNYSTLSEALVLLDLYDGLYLCTDQLNTPDGIELICDERGPDRLVFGSGYPITYFAGAIMALHNAGIPPNDKRRILRGNILRILGIK